MKKYLILLIIPFLFFSNGCEEDENLQEITNSLIDENLIGVWRLTNDGYTDRDWVRSFSSNGRWGYWRETFTHDGDYVYDILSYIDNEQTGDYWIEEDVLFLDYDDSPTDDIWYYNVNGDILTLNLGVWERQN